MTRYDDPELAALFQDEPDLLDLTRAARAREVVAPLREAFPRRLRAQLMAEAQDRLRPRGLARLRRVLGAHAALAALGSAAGVAMVAIAVVAILHGTGVSGVIEPSAHAAVAGVTNLDPHTQAITVAFDQSMDQSSVVKAIHIEPATSFSTRWVDNTLTITPTHGLSASTAYVVRIDNVVARSSAGQAPRTPIVFAFGTQPTPAPGSGGRPTPTPIPTLAPMLLATVHDGAGLVPVPGGGVLVTNVDQLPQVPGAASATSSTSTSTAFSPGTSVGASATGSADTPSPSAGAAATTGGTDGGTPPTGGLVRFGSGTPVRVGPAVAAAAVSPSGRFVAAVEPTGAGAEVVVENLDGSQRRALAVADAGSPVAWTPSSTILFTAGGRLHSVDLQGGVAGAGPAGGLAVPTGSTMILAPGGRLAYLRPVVTPAVDGALVEIATGATSILPGAGPLVAFSANGDGIAWLDTGSVLPRIERLAIPTQLAATAIPTASVSPAGSTVTALALAAGGGRLAITTDARQVSVVDASGHLLATDAESASQLAFLEDGSLALVAGGHASGAALPGPPTPTSTIGSVAPEAQHLVDGLVAAQTVDRSALGTLPAAAGLDLGALTPAGVTQGYVISVTPAPDGDAVTADVRLVAVAAAGSGNPVLFSDEQVTLERTGGGSYTITGLTSSPLSPEPLGPHVVHVAAQRTPGGITVAVSFDSDLDPDSVGGAVSVVGPTQAPLVATQTYDPASRSITLTVPISRGAGSLVHPLSLVVNTGLRDVDGNPLASAYSTVLGV